MKGCPSDCDLCISACPSNALENGRFNVTRCLSYLTQKDELSPEEEKLIAHGGQLYGCEICQDACPFNAPKKSQSRAVNPQDWLNMSDDDFIRLYGHTAVLWRGTEILRRNARLISERNS
jgi:epoxyqueuosine reductase